MKEIPEGLVKPDNITEEAFKKWFNYFLQTFDCGYEPQSVPDSIANGDLTPDNGYAVADLFCNVLDLWTYDSALCCRFVPRFVPCVEAIIAKETFVFIADEGKQYEDFILVVSMLSNQRMISWGTSIRGCWLQCDYRQEYKPKMFVTWENCPTMNNTQDVQDYLVTICTMANYYVVNNVALQEVIKKEDH